MIVVSLSKNKINLKGGEGIGGRRKPYLYKPLLKEIKSISRFKRTSMFIFEYKIMYNNSNSSINDCLDLYNFSIKCLKNTKLSNIIFKKKAK